MKLIISGKPGSGKSTLIAKVLDKLKGKKVAGIMTLEILDIGIRTGFKIIDVASGTERIMASVERKPSVVGKYGVNVHAIDKTVDDFLASFPSAKYVVLDEIGTMEFFSEKFKQMIDMLMASDKVVIAVVHRNHANKYRDAGTYYWLERENFDDILNDVLTELI